MQPLTNQDWPPVDVVHRDVDEGVARQRHLVISIGGANRPPDGSPGDHGGGRTQCTSIAGGLTTPPHCSSEKASSQKLGLASSLAAAKYLIIASLTGPAETSI